MSLIDDILKNINSATDLVDKSNQLELYRTVLHLKENILNLTNENQTLKNENLDLKDRLEFRGKLTFKEPVYFAEGDSIPFCPTCLEGEKKLTAHLVVTKDSSETSAFCNQCRSYFILWKAPYEPANYYTNDDY